MLLPNIDSLQAAVHHDKLEYTLFFPVFYMHMYWFMFIGVEVEYKSEIFVYFRHIVVIVSRCKNTNFFRTGKINVASGRVTRMMGESFFLSVWKIFVLLHYRIYVTEFT